MNGYRSGLCGLLMCTGNDYFGGIDSKKWGNAGEEKGKCFANQLCIR
jgi:hypothetical protein